MFVARSRVDTDRHAVSGDCLVITETQHDGGCPHTDELRTCHRVKEGAKETTLMQTYIMVVSFIDSFVVVPISLDHTRMVGTHSISPARPHQPRVYLPAYTLTHIYRP